MPSIGRSRRHSAGLASLLLTLTACGGIRIPARSSGAVAILPAETAPVFSPFQPLATDAERLAGDPSAAGVPFVVRIRELAGTVLPPNVHAIDENITVVEGTWYAALGDQFDSLALQELPVGSFVYVPRNTPIYGYSPDEVTLQIHGIGPLEQRYLDTLYTLIETGGEDSTVMTDPSRFHYPAGQTVHTVRGTGRIRDGYAIGGLIQYEIAAPNGRLFMAREGEIRPR